MGMGNPPNRFLRSSKLRAILYYSAYGRCQNCGKELDDDWHADHVVPYSISHRTNIFEMQALCPQCNLRKGASMNDRLDFDIDVSKFRIGQREAYNVICNRIRYSAQQPHPALEERATAIALPPRYGKSDVMRVSALRLWRDGLVSNAMFVVPSRILRDQMTDETKINECLRLYRISIPRQLHTYSVVDSPRLARLENSLFVSITVSMAGDHLRDVLTQWVGRMKYKAKVPPVVFFDEAHMASDSNTWGDTIVRLAEAGAYVVMMTGTPFRSDGRPIPFFDYDRVVHSQGNRGERVEYVLRPHWETTLEQAWAENAIGLVTYQPFGILGDHTNIPTGETNHHATLYDLNEEQIRWQYREALRKPEIIRYACRHFLTELSNRRNSPRSKDTSGIVFVGHHDQRFDSVDSRNHAETVKAILHDLDPSLRSRIATSDDPDAQAIIESFKAGEFDIAIVKDMASVGVDIDHLKVSLDLSSRRGGPSFVQKIMRVATIWHHEDYPDDPVMNGVYIAPDDPITWNLYNKFIYDQNGGHITTENVDNLPEKFDIGSKSDTAKQLPQEIFESRGGILPRKMADSRKEVAEGSMIPTADRFFERFPDAMPTITKPSIANFLQEEIALILGGSDEMGEQETEDDDQESRDDIVIVDIERDLKKWRNHAYKAGHQLILKTFRRVHHVPYERGNSEHSAKYQAIASAFWVKQFRNIGVQWKTLKEVDEVEHLKAIYNNILEELRNE